MPHYQFHIHEDDRYYEDEAGHDLADGDAARDEAVETVTALAKDAFVAGSAEILTVDVIECRGGWGRDNHRCSRKASRGSVGR